MIRLSDVGYWLRLWRRHPSLVAVAGLSLGLGVGATTTMYSVVNSGEPAAGCRNGVAEGAGAARLGGVTG